MATTYLRILGSVVIGLGVLAAASGIAAVAVLVLVGGALLTMHARRLAL